MSQTLYAYRTPNGCMLWASVCPGVLAQFSTLTDLAGDVPELLWHYCDSSTHNSAPIPLSSSLH